MEERGVITSTGGLIGIGKSQELGQDVSMNQFEEVYVRTTQRVTLQGKKADLVTEHPQASYTIVEEGDKLAYLEIKDRVAFWRLSKYTVVDVK